MLGSLVRGDGCVAEGAEGANHALGRLGKSVLHDCQQLASTAGPSSSSSAGPSHWNGSAEAALLPPMGADEAAFLHAFEAADPTVALADAWADVRIGPPGPPPPQWEAGPSAGMQQAWEGSAVQHAPPGSIHAGPPEHTTERVRAVLHDCAADPAAQAHLPRNLAAALAPLQLAPTELEAATRRAAHFAAHVRPRLDAPREVVPPWRTADVDSFPASASEEERGAARDAAAAMSAHDDPRWRQSELLAFLKEIDGGAPAAAALERTNASYGEMDLPRQQALVDAYSDAQQQVPSSRVVRDELDGAWREATAGTTAAPAASASAAALEAAWDEAATSEANVLGGLENVWDSLQHGDFESAWEQAWEQRLDAYTFREANPYIGQERLLERGTELFNDGELAQAILALEAAVQSEPDSSAAWQLLGQAHADADDDGSAIACLRRAVDADPHNLDALLALGVSYTNELDQTRALHHLRHWLESHPDFQRLQPPHQPPDARHAAEREGGPYRLHEEVTSLFRSAVEIAPQNADLHAVLGVLHNLSRDYPQV